MMAKHERPLVILARSTSLSLTPPPRHMPPARRPAYGNPGEVGARTESPQSRAGDPSGSVQKSTNTAPHIAIKLQIFFWARLPWQHAGNDFTMKGKCGVSPVRAQGEPMVIAASLWADRMPPSRRESPGQASPPPDQLAAVFFCARLLPSSSPGQ